MRGLADEILKMHLLRRNLPLMAYIPVIATGQLQKLQDVWDEKTWLVCHHEYSMSSLFPG